MELVVTKSNLVEGVSKVERIVAARSTLPIIGNLLFKATKEGLKISANNLEIGIEVNIPANVSKEGEILIPAKTLSGVVSKLPNTEIKLSTTENKLVHISYNKSRFSVHGLPADEFPVLPKIKDGKSLSINSEKISEMIKKSIFSVSQSEDKYVLTGILFEVGKSVIRLVATDGYRLAKSEESFEEDNVNLNVIIPAKALNELQRVIQGKESSIDILVSDNQISFSCDDIYLVSRLIQGKFPDYKQVIPKSSQTKVIVNRQSFLESAERAAVIAAGSANIVKLEVKDENLHLIASAPEVGNVNEVIEVKIKGQSKAQVAFNVRLISEALKVITSPEVVVEVSGPLSPGILKPADSSAFLYIVMPIRTQETVA